MISPIVFFCKKCQPAFWVILLLIACGKKPAFRPGAPAFFYWQTSFRLSPDELRYLDSLDCRKLYLKVLDLGRDPISGEISPLARLEIADSSGLAGREIVPCVFIANSVFQDISAEKIAWLAERVLETARPRAGAECQFDCDWTPSTRQAYFAFLREIKKRLPKNCRLSATIRLHQYKFPARTGVPPVDRGLLMLYNTGEIDEPLGKNSIFDPADAKKYLDGAPADYPLPLDVALPAFCWALVYRDGALWKIIPGFDAAEFADTLFFAPMDADSAVSAGLNSYRTLPSTPPPGEQSGARLYFVRRGTFRSGFYLRPGDQLRMESVPPALLAETARLAASADLADDATAAFFHLDSTMTRRYPVQTIQTIWQEFSR